MDLIGIRLRPCLFQAIRESGDNCACRSLTGYALADIFLAPIHGSDENQEHRNPPAKRRAGDRNSRFFSFARGKEEATPRTLGGGLIDRIRVRYATK